MIRERPIGIDLGTTFSAAAWVDDAGHTEIVRNSEGDLLTPSIVLFSEAELVVGREARNATIVQPDLVAEWVKRDMGLPYYSRPIHGEKFPPEVLQACILRKLKGDLVRELGEVGRVVITVPAYFDEPRRKGTADAGEMAGLKVLDIVNEPTAAALAFGERLGYLTPGDSAKEPMTLLVYDLGGGTFDITLLRLAPGKIETLATDGDVQLGGHDWDMRLLEHVAERFRKVHRLDPRKDPVAMNRALAAAIDAKHTLSARSRAMVRVEIGGQAMEIPVTREQFEEMTADLLERTASTTRQLLTAARLAWKDVNRVLLVGGSTRMPMVAAMLRKLSGIEPDHSVNPDEAVARGAALYAAYLLAKESGAASHANFSITNVNSHSLGVEGIEQDTMRKTNAVLIPRNTPLPTKVTERFVTKMENQPSIVLQVLEGESRAPSECTTIGRTVIRNLPAGLPKNWPVEVTFEYAANGRLTVKAIVPGTDQSTTLDIERAVGLSNAGIDRWKKPIAAAAGFDAFEEMVQEVMEMSDGQGGANKAPRDAQDNEMGEAVAPMGEAGASRNSAGGAQPSVTHFASTAGDARPSSEESGHTTDEESPPGDDLVGEAAKIAFPGKNQNDSGSPVPRWMVNLIGHTVAALLGLLLGYLLLSYMRPDSFPWPW